MRVLVTGSNTHYNYYYYCYLGILKVSCKIVQFASNIKYLQFE